MQEERLELQRKELEDYNEKVRQKQANELERAQSLKMNKEQQVAMVSMTFLLVSVCLQNCPNVLEPC